MLLRMCITSWIFEKSKQQQQQKQQDLHETDRTENLVINETKQLFETIKSSKKDMTLICSYVHGEFEPLTKFLKRRGLTGS